MRGQEQYNLPCRRYPSPTDNDAHCYHMQSSLLPISNNTRKPFEHHEYSKSTNSRPPVATACFAGDTDAGKSLNAKVSTAIQRP